MVKAGFVSMTELKTICTLDEALKLYALYEMEIDIQNEKMKEVEERRD